MKYKIINYEDNIYPEKLKKIKNMPQRLFAIGNYELLNENSIAVIGSRNCTEYGRKATEKIVTKLALMDICIVSGMAIGIDAVAHNSTLDVKGKTIAVLGSGFNYIYPKENIKLYNRIIEEGGLVITEYEPDIEPTSSNFPERNRIVSGLSLGVLVIEAAFRSGTSITANIAKKQGKKVMCIPSDINNKKGVGTNNLIKQGAILVKDEQDIIKEFEELKNNIKRERIISKSVDTKYQKVYDAISTNPITINELVRITKKNIAEVELAITMLELDEVVKTIPNKGIIRI